MTAGGDAGFTVCAVDPATARWADAALGAARGLVADPAVRRANLRHGGTWFVGVDVLPNADDGSIADVPLTGDWQDLITPPDAWHRAQLSVIYPGYPGQDDAESDAAHRYRVHRHAAHVDGLLPVGPERRRYLREPHRFVLGFPLNDADAAPLMVWPGSHLIMGQAFRAAIADAEPTSVDLTECYHAARRRVFDTIAPSAVQAGPGQAIVFHRHLLHGVAAWTPARRAPQKGRMIAYFRPEFTDAGAWLAQD